MRLILCAFLTFLVIVAVSAKKQPHEPLDVSENEEPHHSAKKYTKDFQKGHHHEHKHKAPQKDELPKEELTKPKKTPVEVSEPELELQSNLETSKKAIEEQRHKEQTKDLHLQDLAYEETLKQEKKKNKGHHHGPHHAEFRGKHKVKHGEKLLSESETKSPVPEKVIEDSFEPLKETTKTESKKGRGKNQKDKSKNKKKAYEKNKGKNGKSKDKNKKNKDKKHKNKDKKF